MSSAHATRDVSNPQERSSSAAPFDLRKHGIELYRWPFDGPPRSRVVGVLALYRPQQIAVVADAAPTYAENRDAALERVVDLSMLDLVSARNSGASNGWHAPTAWSVSFRQPAPMSTNGHEWIMSNPNPDPAGDVDRFIRRAIAGAVHLLGKLPASGRGAPSSPPPSARDIATLDALDFVRASWRAHRDPAALRQQLMAIVTELDRVAGAQQHAIK